MNNRELRDLAWIGDAVLALWARQWLLEQPKHPNFSRQELFVRLTSNAFLQSVGEPTQVEARIGTAYLKGGLEDGFSTIDEVIKPIFVKHLANVSKGRRGQKK